VQVLKAFNFIVNQRNILLVSLLTLLTGCATSRVESPVTEKHQIIQNESRYRLIAPEILRLDVEQIVKRVVEVHPEPFAMVSEQAFRAKAQLVKQSIRFPLSPSEFYLRVAPLIAMLGDIHSNLELPKYLPTQTREAKSVAINSSPKLFPLAVLYENEHIYVAADLSESPQIPVGALIKSINGAPIDYLLKVMKGLTVLETESGQRRKIQVDFPWLISVMGYARSGYEIVYQWQNQQITLTIEGIVPAKTQKEEVLADSSEVINQSNSQSSFYGNSFLTDKTALLWFNDFKEDPQVFSEFLEKQFQKINNRQIKNLIIDVRYNEGGLSQNIKSLLAYLTERPIFWSQAGQINISKPLKKLHRQKTRQRRKNKYQWGLQWLPLEWTDSLLYEVSWSDVGQKIPVEFEKISPQETPTPLKFVVLTNGFCYSACSSFVATVNYYDLAETIGEMAGSYARVQYAYPLITQLSHSQLKLALPTMKLIFDNKFKDRKSVMGGNNNLISPDLFIQRNSQQVIERQDVSLTTALLRIESTKEFVK